MKATPPKHESRRSTSKYGPRSHSRPQYLAYQSTLIPNCTWRDVVEVLVIAPAVPETPVGFAAVGGVNVIKLGVLKFARLSRLKISARN